MRTYKLLLIIVVAFLAGTISSSRPVQEAVAISPTLATLQAAVIQLQADVAALQNGLSTETAARNSAETTLQNGLSTETAARHQGDADTLSAANQYTDSQITAESAARQAADALLQNNINNIASTSGSTSIVTYIASGSTDCPSNNFCAAEADCNSGDVALGGGFTAPQIGRLFQVHYNGPVGLPEASGWAVEVFNTHSEPITLTAKAVCLDKTP